MCDGCNTFPSRASKTVNSKCSHIHKHIFFHCFTVLRCWQNIIDLRWKCNRRQFKLTSGKTKSDIYNMFTKEKIQNIENDTEDTFFGMNINMNIWHPSLKFLHKLHSVGLVSSTFSLYPSPPLVLHLTLVTVQVVTVSLFSTDTAAHVNVYRTIIWWWTGVACWKGWEIGNKKKNLSVIDNETKNVTTIPGLADIEWWS